MTHTNASASASATPAVPLVKSAAEVSAVPANSPGDYRSRPVARPSALRTLVPNTKVGGLLTGGLLALMAGFGGMTAWAALAPLHGAVMAAGALAPETGRKVVRHTEGGRIAEVMVAEGSSVQAGEPLFRLEDSEARARVEMLTHSWLEATATDARLSAELFDQPDIEWPEDLTQHTQQGSVTRLMQNQAKLFQVRRQQQDTESRLLVDRLEMLKQQISGLEKQKKYNAGEQELIDEDISITRGLLTRGNATRTKLVELLREQARLFGRASEIETAMAQSRQSSIEAEGELVRRRNDYREKVLNELEKARANLAQLSEQKRDAENRLDARTVKAPDGGAVVMHSHFTRGSTIAANEPLLDIVPEDRALLAEVRVQPQDIKSLQMNLPVKIQLSAYDSRVVGMLDGTVTYVSADRVQDQQSRQDYYLVRVALKNATPEEVEGLKIKPGMPVEARILLSARTPLDYLIQPLTDSYNKAFIQS